MPNQPSNLAQLITLLCPDQFTRCFPVALEDGGWELRSHPTQFANSTPVSWVIGLRGIGSLHCSSRSPGDLEHSESLCGKSHDNNPNYS